MIIGPWLAGQLRRRTGRIFATAIGVAVAVALVGSLAAFIAQSKRTMTQRSIANVPIDWQVQGAPSTSGSKLLHAVATDRNVADAVPVEFAHVSGFSAR